MKGNTTKNIIKILEYVTDRHSLILKQQPPTPAKEILDETQDILLTLIFEMEDYNRTICIITKSLNLCKKHAK